MPRSVFGVRLEQRVACLDQCVRGIESELAKGLSNAMTRAVERLKVVTAVERPAPSKALVEHYAEREQIRSGATVPPERVLRGHVGDLALERLALNASGMVHRLRDAEVGELHFPRATQKHV